MSEIPLLKDWQWSLGRQIDNHRLNEDDLLSIIRLCEETLYEIEPPYIFVRDQRSVVQDWLNEFRRFYLTRFRKEAPVLSMEELQSEEVLDSPQRRKAEVRRVALDLAGPNQEVTDQAVLDELKAAGKRFIAENPTATISTILVGFKAEFEKVEGVRGRFRRKIKVKPEKAESLMQELNRGDRVIISLEAKIAPDNTKGKHGKVVNKWDRFPSPEEEGQKYFVYEVQLDGTEGKIEVEGYDLLSE